MGVRERQAPATTPSSSSSTSPISTCRTSTRRCPPHPGQYANAHTQAWAEKIDSFDGFIFVTPEYNHAPSGVLKNAIDFLYREWNNKAAALVSYGASASGLRAAELLRLILAEVQIADVRQQVAFSLIHDFENFSVLKPARSTRRTCAPCSTS